MPLRQSRDKVRYLWYGHFQDSLKLKGWLTVENDASIIRKLTTRYLEMPVPIEATSLLANVEYRTTIICQDTLSLNKQ